MKSMIKLHQAFFASALLFVGAGCVGTLEEPLPPLPVECPNVCTAICAGLPEPELPPDCPTPMCACDLGSSPSESTNEERACERDEDCVYADNSTCPFTSLKNIVAINKAQTGAFSARRSEPPEGTLCIELYAVPEGEPACVRNLCTVNM